MDVLQWILIILSAFGASLLTFYSGFGLGTILLPVFSLFFEIPIAIAMTALVHLLNNVFKFGLTRQNVQWNLVKLFGLPSIIFAFCGAFVLSFLSNGIYTWNFKFLELDLETDLLKICVGSLMIIFSWLENLNLSLISKNSKFLLVLGGALSGFFGGLTGHQGALRSMFLSRTSIEKDALISTMVVIACGVDLARLVIYSGHSEWAGINIPVLFIACISAFGGAWLGNQYLKKITDRNFKLFMTLALTLFGLGMIFGFL